MICSFFKFSILEHFWVLKWIAWVDIRVVLIFYSFQGVRVDLEGELEKWTKCTQIGKLAKLQLIVIMIVFLAFQLKWYISNSKVKPPFAQCEFQMPPKKAKHGGARKKAGRKSKSGEFSNDKTLGEKLKSHRERLQYGCGNAERRCVNFLMNKFIICTCTPSRNKLFFRIKSLLGGNIRSEQHLITWSPETGDRVIFL